MKQVWFTADKDGNNKKLELLEVEVPPVSSNQVRVKMHYAALCATDLHQVTMGAMNTKPGHAMGHECAGIIEEVGTEAAKYDLQIGDKVTLYPASRLCGICDACKEGRGQYCNNQDVIGGFAEYVVIDASSVHKIPAHGDLKEYCLVEPINCTMRAMDLAGVEHGATVAISGVGGIGSILLNMILLTGAARITAVDPILEKRKLALDMGAQYAIDPIREDVVARGLEITDGRGYDYVFEASGAKSAAHPAFQLIGKCGTIIYFAVFPPTYEYPLNLHELYMKEGRILTVFETPSTMRRSIEMVPRMQMDKIIGTVLPLSEFDKAIELFKKSIYPKILLDCRK